MIACDDYRLPTTSKTRRLQIRLFPFDIQGPAGASGTSSADSCATGSRARRALGFLPDQDLEAGPGQERPESPPLPPGVSCSCPADQAGATRAMPRRLPAAMCRRHSKRLNDALQA
jgi:hypothetical protein